MCGSQTATVIARVLAAHRRQEWDFAVTVLAPDFARFVRGLRAPEAFENG